MKFEHTLRTLQIHIGTEIKENDLYTPIELMKYLHWVLDLVDYHYKDREEKQKQKMAEQVEIPPFESN